MEKISVIVPVKDSETIDLCLKSLIEQNSKNYEVIIVDESIRDISEIIKNYKVRYFKLKNAGISKSRNFGIKHATGSIVAFTDSDCIVPKNWLQIISKTFTNKKIDSISGIKKVHNKKNSLSHFIGYEENYRYKKISRNEKYIFGTHCGAFRKEIFNSIKFNERIKVPGIEDVILGFELGKNFKNKFLKKFFVWHENPTKLSVYLKKQFYKSYFHTIILPKYFKETIECKNVGSNFFYQYIITLGFILSFLIGFYYFNFFLIFFWIFLFILSNLKFVHFIAKYKNINFIMKSYYFLFLRNMVMLFGITLGLVSIIISFFKQKIL